MIKHDSQTRPPNRYYHLVGPKRLDDTREMQLQALSQKPHSVTSAHILAQLNVLCKERAESIVLKHYRYGNYHQLTLPKDKIGSAEGAIRAAITAVLLPHWGKSTPSAGFNQDRRRNDIASCDPERGFSPKGDLLEAYLDWCGDKANDSSHCIVQGPIITDADGKRPQLQTGHPTANCMATIHEINSLVEQATLEGEKLIISRPISASNAQRLGHVMARHVHVATDQHYLVGGAEPPDRKFFGLVAGPECKHTVKKVQDFIVAGCERIPGIEQVYCALPPLSPAPKPRALGEHIQADVVSVYETFVASRPALSVTQGWREEARQCTRAIHRLQIDYTPYRDRFRYLATIWCHTGVMRALENALGVATSIANLTDTDPRKILMHEIASNSDEWPLEQTALLWSLSRRVEEEIDDGTRKILNRLATNATSIKNAMRTETTSHDCVKFRPQQMLVGEAFNPGAGLKPYPDITPPPTRRTRQTIRSSDRQARKARNNGAGLLGNYVGPSWGPHMQYPGTWGPPQVPHQP